MTRTEKTLVPEATPERQKQGKPVLSRNEQDTGMVAILDPRVVSKHYGRRFLDALPECNLIIHRA